MISGKAILIFAIVKKFDIRNQFKSPKSNPQQHNLINATIKCGAATLFSLHFLYRVTVLLNKTL